MSYKLKLDIFEGPLDLLLYLIKKNDLDIRDIPITAITEQYMAYIETMKLLDLEIVGDFLVMAATLMHIKSKMLLPVDPVVEEAEGDPRDELVRRLQEYKIFKEIAEQLKEKEAVRQRMLPREIDDQQHRELREEATEVYFEANLFDLINAFTKALSRVQDDPIYEVVQEEFTVEMKIHDILHRLLKQPRVLLTDLFARARTKMEVIVTFMGVLELIRLREVKVMQKRLFADVEVVRNKENVIPLDPAEEAAVEAEGRGGRR